MAAPPSIRPRRRRFLLTLAGAGMAASLLPVPTAAAGPASSPPTTAVARPTPPVPQLRWVGCREGFQCAQARVPLDYDQPRGATISLALARLPARDPARKLGSIFLNPGGPGDSGVDFVRDEGRELFSAEVRARFDLVGFDPRGIARSTPLRCFDTAEQAAAASPPFPFPVTPAEERVWVAADRKFAEACARRAGPIIDHMATANVARDLDLLRQAVGDRQLSYYGQSYGSYLGVTYANLFPGKVRALAIDSVDDPIAYATGRGNQARRLPVWNRVGSAAGSYATLREFFRLCRRGGPNCAFSAGNPRRRYDRLAQRLLAQPARLPDGNGGTMPFTYAELVALTWLALYDPETWPQLATFLDRLDTAPSSRAATAALDELLIELGGSEESEEDSENSEDFPEGQWGVVCSDTDNPATVEAWSRAAARADRAAPYFGRLWTWISSICQPWPGKDADRYAGPFTARTAHPVLVIGTRFDPATPYQGAVVVSRLLPRARLLTLEGWGHVALYQSSCVERYLSRYLLTIQLPPRGAVCKPDVVPFARANAVSDVGDEVAAGGLRR